MAENQALAEAMDELGFSQAGLARRLNAENEALTGREGRLTDRDVRRYLEGSTKWPHARQRVCLEGVFGRSSTELGFVPRGKTVRAPTEDLVHRRTFITATSGTALTAATPALTRLGMSDVHRFHHEYVQILEDDWRVGGSRQVEGGAVELSMRIQSVLSTGTASPRVRQRLYSLGSDVISTAAFAAIDAKAMTRARAYLDKAVTFAGLSGDSETQYHVWNHLTMTAGQRGDFVEGAAAADAMKVLHIARRDPVHASLAHMRNAKALARSHQRSGALKALAMAKKSFARGADGERPAWIGFYDQSEVDGLSASVWFSLGDFGRAEYFFHRALSGIRQELVRNRALYSAHLALAQASQGELEMACATGRRAYDMLKPGSGSKRTTDTLGRVRKLVIAASSNAPEITSWIERSRQWI
ncbi:XRE family transcriptional regulator [Streptomyces pinistramenti]|uniref:XRE family transcriptional regulator n=1 Tax=Streptomyces pinistramenti TaxID=2884812 RepID=UPI001D06BC5A|nr:XRE family transcriptional regulator [Streptomyces pinistramenti]MCB5909835.1 XRE family transcriptional regulator [Streptomyces pinistramenti]